MPSFWDNYGGDLINLGANIYGRGQARKEQDRRLQQTKGPLYDQQIGISGGILSSTELDPNKAAASRFARDKAALDPHFAEDELALQRRLVAQGQFGLATHSPVAGVTPTPGVAMNPQLAAFYAAKNRAVSDLERQSYDRSQADISRNLDRAGALQQRAESSLAGRSQPNVQRVIAPSRPSLVQTLAPVAGKLLTDPAVLKGIGSAVSGLFSNFGGWEPFSSSGYQADFSLPDWNY